MWTVQGFLDGVSNLLKDPRFTNLEVNTSGLLLILVVVGLFSAAFYANIGDHTDALKDKVNAGIGSGSGVVHRADDPPIPPPSQITSLRIYPIKSCRGIEVTHTRLKRAGLTLDRNWMFIGLSDMKFLTIRGDPSMTLIDTAITTGKDGEQMLQISIHGSDKKVEIPAFPSKEWLSENTTLKTVEIWEKETDGYIYSDQINKPFCDFFNKPVALVYKGPTHRMVAINGRKDLYGESVPHHFADVMSLQIASEASIKDLNAQLGHAPDSPAALTIERFRPNIIIKGRDSHPWEEDTWKRIRISTSFPHEEALYKLDLDVVARCARCQVPNVDPATAEKHPKQPWETLMKTRRVDSGGPAKYKPCFGMMAIPRNEGKVAVGGTLEVLETTDKHWYDERAFKDL